MTWKQTTFELNHENPNYKMRKLCLDSILSVFFVCLYLIIVLSKNIFVHTIMAWGQVILESLLSIGLCNDCIVVIAHPYHGNVVFIVHFYIITTFMLPSGLQAISGRPELFKQRSKRCKNWANINDVRDYHMSRSCPSKIIDDEYKWSRI